ATVTDTDTGGQSAPTGTVSFANGVGEHGSFSNPGASCALAGPTSNSSSCTVDYTPSAFDGGSQTITGSYGGSAVHDTSSGHDGLTVTKRSTSTVVSCSPSSRPINATTTCTATVTDTDTGGQSAPTGTVSFANGVGE